MKRVLWFACLLLACLGVMQGCKEALPEITYPFKIYYKELSFAGIDYYGYEPEQTEPEKLIQELWEVLCQSDLENEYISIVPEDVMLLRTVLENGNLELYFNESYQSLDTVSELLLRAGIVRTMCQVDTVETVTFFVNEKPLTNSTYAPLGAQKAADYVDLVGNGLGNMKRTVLTLYYANEEGDTLIKKRQDVVYESSYSLEKDVIKRLTESDEEEGFYSVLPESIQVISIGVRDHICYVNFDSSFLTDAREIDGNLIVYAIVNSLTEIPEIQKVQILINGDSNVVFRNISLSSPLEQNLSY